jgi:hypothetical protein
VLPEAAAADRLPVVTLSIRLPEATAMLRRRKLSPILVADLPRKPRLSGVESANSGGV